MNLSPGTSSPLRLAGVTNGSVHPRPKQDVRATLQQFCTSIGINDEVTKETLTVWDDVFQQQQLADSLDMQVR